MVGYYLQVFTLEPDPGAAGMLRQPCSLVEVTGAVHVAIMTLELFPKLWVRYCRFMSLLELSKAIDEGFRDILPSKLTKTHGKDGRAIGNTLVIDGDGQRDGLTLFRGRDG